MRCLSKTADTIHRYRALILWLLQLVCDFSSWGLEGDTINGSVFCQLNREIDGFLVGRLVSVDLQTWKSPSYYHSLLEIPKQLANHQSTKPLSKLAARLALPSLSPLNLGAKKRWQDRCLSRCYTIAVL